MAIGSLYRPWLEAARQHGLDLTPALSALGLSEAQLIAPGTRLSQAQGRGLVRSLVALTGDRELGLRAAEQFALGDADLIGYLARNALHPLEALELVERYARVLGDTADFGLERACGQVILRFRLSGERSFEPEAADFTAAVGAHVLRELSCGRALPLAVQLARARPHDPVRYRRFFAAPITYAAPCTSLIYAEAPLLVPFAQRDPQLLRILEERATEITKTLPETTSWLDRVRAEVERTLAAGILELGEVAARCGMSDRTLRRRLAAAQTSYRELVDELRRERALALLRSGGLRVGELAQQLGYSDATAFARAFRRWTGRSPQEYIASAHVAPLRSLPAPRTAALLRAPAIRDRSGT